MFGVHVSIPNISLIVFHLVLGQNLAVLLLERQSPMVLALIGDVSFQIGQLRLPDRERAVTVLPGETAYCSPVLLIHFEELVLSSSINLLIAIVRANEQAMWMWSSPLPILWLGHP
jgi:hypothetical protein